MRMKKFNLMMWQGLVLSALALGFASCEPSDTPCPNKKEADGNTSQGVTVMLEMENVETGETTRTALGDGDYSFTAKDGGGDVQALGLGFRKKPIDTNDIDVKLTYYAKENVVFQGWSWRYSEDPVGTHRGKSKDEILTDYVATPALQSESGVQKLALGDDATKFTCQYRPGTDNRVYVKVKYALSVFPVFSGKFIQLPGKATAWKQLQKGYQNKIIRHPLFGVGQPYYREAMDLVNALTEAKQNEMKWLDAWYDVYNDPVMVEWDNAKKASYLENLYNEIVEAARNLASAAMKRCYITAPHVSYLNLGTLGVGIDTGRSYPIFQLLDELGQYDMLLTGYDKTLLERSFTSLTDSSYIKLLYDDKLKLGLNLSINENNQPIPVRRVKPLFFNERGK
ncbi:hypothetical protein [Porphyromonas somerae]|uniref:hypothetical protein n=1 Tax=Porphyromonas somerae TaxID=322095 RepID=UPI002A82A42C|nr:hypothetical protein [Porphyromonas somerae]MDY3883828.1 hypothetical protein [Porphyromonas somerae]